MKYYSIIFCLILSANVSSFAQNNFKVSSLFGFENNINKTPNTLVEDGEIINKEEFHLNSFYQDFQINYKYFKEWKKSTLSLNIDPEIRCYFSETEANTSLLNSRMTYKYKIKRNMKWESTIQYKIKNRQGQDLDANELSLPFGYKLFKFNTGLRFRMSKNNRSLFKLNYGHKKFDDTESRNVQYKLYGLESEIKKIKWKNHLLHSYGVTMGYTQRNYTITDFEEETASNRIWSYLDAGVFYKIPINKNWNLQPQVNFQKRIDNTKSVFGYQQIRPEINITFEDARFLAKFTTSYTYRKFKNLTAKNSEEITLGSLKYNYLRIFGNVVYNIDNNFSILLEGYLINRKSNNTNINTNAFRSYNNNYIGLGIRYKF